MTLIKEDIIENDIELQEVKGVGEKLSNKIIKAVGGKENLNHIVNNLELERITEIEGISQRKAIEIMNQLLGNPAQNFLKSERAFQLYEEIIQKILYYSNTQYSENRILLLSPLNNETQIKESIDFVMAAKENVSNLPIIKLRGLMKNLKKPEEVKAKYNPSKAILVESKEDNDYLTDLGLNKYYPIITVSNSPSLEEEISSYELILYIYSYGTMDFGEMNNVIMINKEAPIEEIVPEIVLDYFNKNIKIFNQVKEIRKILNKNTVLEDIEPILNEINLIEKNQIDLDEIVENVKRESDKELKNSIQSIDFDGDEVLDLLNNHLPATLEEIFEDILHKSKEKIYEKTSLNFDPFLKKYPLEIDNTEIERVKKDIESKKENDLFDKKIEAASYLSSIKEEAIREVEETLKFDYEFSLGCFAYEYDLSKPVISKEFILKDALHLDLALKKNDSIQSVDYILSEEDNVALLTGANSGGKTTLLETIGQISIMAHMGLPVSAKHVEVKLLDEIYYFSKKRSLDAGAFESFLNVFIPIVTTKTEKLVLLDELEGITELEAAVKIISSFIDMIKDTNSFGIIVTHMARELMKYTNIRVDGIEAKGLDENYELIVNRTPKMNCLARSTPELILKRIYENSDGDLKKVYEKILEKF